jgi:hypothetical protein
MANDTRIAHGLTVQRYTVIGTTITVYEAWESTAPVGSSLYGHGTLLRIEGQLLGRVGTRRATVEARPGVLVGTWSLDQEQDEEEEAYAAIIAAFPEAAGGQRFDGKIETG